MTPTPFTKPGCDCHGCVAYGEHEDPNVFRGWHIITLTHHADGRESMACRCGAKTARLRAAGKWIAEHRRLEVIGAQG